MGLMDRVSRLMTANLNHMLDQAEDPEVLIGQVIHELDEALVGLRRETVAAVAHEKQLEKRLAAAREQAEQVEREARLALDSGDETLARQIVARRLQTLRSRDALEAELESAHAASSRLRDELWQMQERADVARRQKSDLLRRKRLAEARLRTEEVSRRSAAALGAVAGEAGAAMAAPGRLEGFADAVSEIESRAEAARELWAAEDEPRRKLARLSEDRAVEEELARLKADGETGH